MSIDEDVVPRIAVIGAGPIGLEAALYARYLGYQVVVFEQGTVADSVRRWGHVRMFSPFGLNRSALGVAALKAQHENLVLPDAEALLTGAEFAEQYLIPLSQTDLLHDCVHENVEVVSIGRDGVLKTDNRETLREDFTFRILVRKEDEEDVVDVDFVLDTSGVFTTPNYLGHGGIPAVGELKSRSEIDYHVPDVLGTDRERFAEKRILVVGSGYSAASAIVSLGELIKQSPATQVTWLTRRSTPAEATGPLPRRENDRLPERDQLAVAANRMVEDETSGIQHTAQTSVLSIAWESESFRVITGGRLEGEHEFDRVIANVGFRPDIGFQSELIVDLDASSMGSAPLARELHAAGHIDCLDLDTTGPESLLHPEPNFFILGSKSFGRDSNFLLAFGLKQIRDVFTMIADRESLDLYETMSHQK